MEILWATRRPLAETTLKQIEVMYLTVFFLIRKKKKFIIIGKDSLACQSAMDNDHDISFLEAENFYYRKRDVLNIAGNGLNV